MPVSSTGRFDREERGAVHTGPSNLSQLPASFKQDSTLPKIVVRCSDHHTEILSVTESALEILPAGGQIVCRGFRCLLGNTRYIECHGRPILDADPLNESAQHSVKRLYTI